MLISSLVRRSFTIASAVLALAAPVRAQSQPGEWRFSVYPVLAWVPTTIGIEVNVPTDIGGGSGGSGGSGGGIEHGKILDSRFDGAFLGGFSATNGTWRIDADGLWAAVGGDRPSSPALTVDADVVYLHGALGFKIFNDVFLTGGVRRFALKYDIKIADVARFTRKPGLWDPLVGVAYHHVGEKFEAHGLLDVGGFGVGSDSEFGTSFRVDWKPVRHFGLTGGYSYLRFKFKHEVAGKTLEATQTLAGPVAGIGLYF